MWTMTEHGSATRVAELVESLNTLRVDHQTGTPAPYQQLLLLWAIARALSHKPRLVAFGAVETDLAQMLRPFAVGSTPPDPASPWFALRNSNWWQIDLRQDRLSTGERIRDVVREQNPRAGLTAEVYQLVRSNAAFRERTIQAMRAAVGASPAFDRLLAELGVTQDAPPDHPWVPDLPSTVSTPTVQEISPELHVVEQFEAEPPWDPQTRHRREAGLQKRYRTSLEAQGHEVCRHKILPERESMPLFTDLLDITTGELVEAKASSTRESIRLALGQVFDYARYVDHASLAVLVPERPRQDLINLLTSQGVSCIWEQADDTFAREDREKVRT